MTDLTAMTADQLEKRIRTYCMDNRNVNPKGEAVLAEAIRRAAALPADGVLFTRDQWERLRKAAGCREGCTFESVVESLCSKAAALPAAESAQEGVYAHFIDALKDRAAAAEARCAELEKERDELLAAPEATLGRLRERTETENWSGPLAEDFARLEKERDEAVTKSATDRKFYEDAMSGWRLAADELAAAEARLATLTDEDALVKVVDQLERDLVHYKARLATLKAALEQIAVKQRERLETYQSLGIVFDGPLGTDPTNWQHVAFSTYTDLCEIETIAAAALQEETP